MTDLKPAIVVSTDLDRRLVRFSASGLWGPEQVAEGSAKIGAAIAPFVQDRSGFSILGDYSEAIVQPRDTADSIRQSFAAAKKLGLKRIAVINAPPLVKMQYQRLSDLVEIEFFASRVDAMTWLVRDPSDG